MADRWPCENCGKETKRINHDLELPSCSVICDNALYEDQRLILKPETSDNE